MKHFLLLLQSLMVSAIVFSQGVAINNTGVQANPSAILDLNSTTKGFVIPRMTTAQRLAIPAPPVGLQVYQTDAITINEPKGFYFFNSDHVWQKMAGSGEVIQEGWTLNGNQGTNTTNFLGTKDANDLRIGTSNTIRMLFKSNGNIGINTNGDNALFSLVPGNTTPEVPVMRLEDFRTTTVPSIILFNSKDNPLISAATIGKGKIIDISRQGEASPLPALAVSTKGTGPAVSGNNTAGGGAGLEGTSPDGVGAVLRSPSGLGLFVEANRGAEINAIGSGKDAVLVSMKSNNTNPAGIIGGVHAITEGNSGFLIGMIAAPISNNTNAKLIGVYATPRPGPNVEAVCLQGDGNMTISGNYFSSSDRKLKKNIQPMEAALNKLMRLSPSTYEYRSDEYKMNLPKEKQNGLIAQDVQAIFPELVAEQVKPAETSADGKTITSPEIKYLSINYSGLVPILISAVQEQQKIIDELKKEMAEIKAGFRSATK